MDTVLRVVAQGFDNFAGGYGLYGHNLPSEHSLCSPLPSDGVMAVANIFVQKLNSSHIFQLCKVQWFREAPPSLTLGAKVSTFFRGCPQMMGET